MKQKTQEEVDLQNLIILAQKGDNEAYYEFLCKLRVYTSKYCKFILRNWSDYEDCIQECLLNVHRFRHTYVSSRPVIPWIKAIIRNKCIDWMRKEINKINYELKTDRIDFYQDRKAYQPKEVENKLLLSNLINRLPERHKQVIMLTKIEGLTEKEAAKKLKISPANVKIRTYRALKQLKNIAHYVFLLFYVTFFKI